MLLHVFMYYVKPSQYVVLEVNKKEIYRGLKKDITKDIIEEMVMRYLVLTEVESENSVLLVNTMEGITEDEKY